MNTTLEKSAPYWWDDAPREQAVDIQIPQVVDVAVIGAGFSGLCAALELAHGGASVVVFEAGVLGYGASTRNGGMLGPSFHKLGIAGLKSKYGIERTNTILRESMGFVEYLRDFLKAEEIDAEFSQNGRFRGALRAHHYDAMARQLDELQTAAGVKGVMVSKADQHTETGSPIFHGGVVYDYDAGLHPARYHDGLVRRAREAGVVIVSQNPVTKLVKTGTGFDVVTSNGTTRAGQVAVCTNGYTGSVTKDLRRRIIPLRSAMIATEPLEPGLMKQLMPKNRVYGDSRRLVAYYRPSPDGTRILFGARAAGLGDNPAANMRSVRSSMCEIYPQLSQTAISHVWSGLVAYTFDHVPHVGQFGGGQQGGVFYAMGYCGSGVARASYFGNKLGRKMLGRPDSETAFDDLVFETRPFYTGNPWFMPAILAWHRIADRFGL
jgi:glycine/D-amino acid oxidase-like deaminating enzyme